MNKIEQYHLYRDELNLSIYKSIYETFMPTRLRIAYAVLRGRPVAYRLHIMGGWLKFVGVDGAWVADCTFDDREEP